MSAKKTRTSKRKVAANRPLTIYDGDKYFDASFSSDEFKELRDLIQAEIGLGDVFMSIRKTFDLIDKADKKISRALNIYPVPDSWSYIHVCKELEIDYKSLAKNVPKLPIEPFYAFVETQFPHFKFARNDSQKAIQDAHIQCAFVDWIDSVCPRNGCKKSSHGWGCWDRYEDVDYIVARMRICYFNDTRPRFAAAPLRLVHTA